MNKIRFIPLSSVISEILLPLGVSHADFRNLRTWRDKEGFHAAVGLISDENGTILFYGSSDALHWCYKGILAARHGKCVTMWQCPDFFTSQWKGVDAPQCP